MRNWLWARPHPHTFRAAIPSRARSTGFSIGALFALPGLALLPAIGALGDHIGLRNGLLLTVPVFLAGSLIVSSAGRVIDRDIRNVTTAVRARAEAAAERGGGRRPLLVVRDLMAGYGCGAVLSGVDLDLAEGEIVALLGPNGAGKSTLIRAIAGIVEADDGAVIFEGRDITHVPPDAIARLGIAQVPGGEGVFPTVIFAGDPIMPIYLTRACATIGYFPEWVITGTAFTDTTTLGRYYDPREWAHAFGISSLAVPTPIQASDAYRIYRWWYRSRAVPPAKTAVLDLAPLMQLFQGIELAGPHLTAASFAEGLFRAPPAGGSPIAPLEAFGSQGAPPAPSYTAPADYTFIWYDAAATGTNEQGADGTGLLRYVQGGRRYPAGTVPSAQVPMFSLAGSVTGYASLPRADRPPSYPPWPGSPAARG